MVKKTNSKGVRELIKLFDDMVISNRKISYKTEFTFNELKGKGNKPYRYDFYINLSILMVDLGMDNPKDLIIERDGQQHFSAVEIMGGQERFEEGQKRDIIKEQYLINHGFNFVRIPYWLKFEQICEIIAHSINEILNGNKIYISYPHYSKHVNYNGYIYKEYTIPK